MKLLIFAILAFTLIIAACTPGPDVPDAADAAAAAEEEYPGIPPTPVRAPDDDEFEQLFPDRFDAQVDAIIIKDSTCEFCNDLNSVIADLQRSGVAFANTSEREYTDSEVLIERHNISRVPTILLSDNLLSYEAHAAALATAGLEPFNGFFVLESPPVYRDLQQDRIRGLVNITIVEDDTCTACFDGATLEDSFRNLGLVLNTERRIDAKTQIGTGILSQYNITKLPAILLIGDLEPYTLFNQAWPTAGTIEEDGTYVFRNLESLGPTAVYLDVTTGKVVVPSDPTTN